MDTNRGILVSLWIERVRRRVLDTTVDGYSRVQVSKWRHSWCLWLHWPTQEILSRNMRLFHEDMQVLQLGGDVGCHFCTYFLHLFPLVLPCELKPSDYLCLFPFFSIINSDVFPYFIILPFRKLLLCIVSFLWLTGMNVGGSYLVFCCSSRCYS